MAIIAGTYDFTVQRRADHTESIRITDSTDSAVNLTGFTIAAQVWDKARTGKYADFIILDQNPFELPTAQLENIKIQSTFINGNKVIQTP